MTTQLALKIPADPTDPHAEARAHVIAAITWCATTSGGIVSQNAVREHLTAHDIPPSIIGATYQAMHRRGHLARTGPFEVSTDVAGGNAGKEYRTWRWVGAA